MSYPNFHIFIPSFPHRSSYWNYANFLFFVFTTLFSVNLSSDSDILFLAEQTRILSIRLGGDVGLD